MWILVLAFLSANGFMGIAYAQLPACADVEYTDQQLDSAIGQAEIDLGIEVDLNSSSYIDIVWRMAEILGCELPPEMPPPGLSSRDRLIGDGALAKRSPEGMGTCQGANPCDAAYATFEGPEVQYCGTGDSRDGWAGIFPVGSNLMNRVCATHDACYCNHCIREECNFAEAGETAACDAAFFHACDDATGLGDWVCALARAYAGPGPGCALNATTCSGVCTESVCVRGQCVPVKNSAGQRILPINTPVAVTVFYDYQDCDDGQHMYCAPIMTCCSATVTTKIKYTRCDGGGVKICSGHDAHSMTETCGQRCGTGLCSIPYLLHGSWDDIATCASGAGMPVVPGPLPLNEVVWFGSYAQLHECLQCVPPP